MNEDTPLNDPADVVPDVAQPVTEAAPPAPSAGAQLKALREARGWTIEQVANQLNLAARQIDALEHDNYAALPGMVIVRGFIRTYAKLLNADAAPILAAIKDENGAAAAAPAPARSVTSASFSETHLKSDNSRRFPLKAVIAVIVVLAIGAAVLLQGRHLGGKSERNAPEVKTGELASVVPQETPVAVPPAPEQATTPAPAATTETKTMPVSQSAAEAKPAETSTPAEAGKNVLAIHVHQDSWIEIRRADNDKVVFSSLLKAGASESIELPGPVSMVVGNAAGVEVTLRGAPVDLKGNASNVARVNLK